MQAESKPPIGGSSREREVKGISVLSEDILREVFLLRGPGGKQRFPPSKRDHVLVLSQVCTLWKNVIYNTPLFWNNVALFDPRDESFTDAIYLSKLKEWFSRANTLHIRAFDTVEINRRQLIWDVLTQFSHRIESLSLFYDSGRLDELFSGWNFPNLRTLLVMDTIPQVKYQSDPPSVLKPFQMPVLREVVWSAYGFGSVDDLPLSLPLTQLTCLRITSQPTGSYLAAISCCKALERHGIAVDTALAPLLHSLPRGAISLPYLIALEVYVRGVTMDHNLDVLRPFSTPSLRHFEFLTEEAFPYAQITSFLTQPRVRLQSLWIETGSGVIKCDELAQVITRVPTLKKLVIAKANYLIKDLMFLDPNCQLEEIHLEVTRFRAFLADMDKLVKMDTFAYTRRPALVVYQDKVTSSEAGKVTRFRLAGLDIRVETHWTARVKTSELPYLSLGRLYDVNSTSAVSEYVV